MELKSFRKSKKLNKKEMALLLGISPSYYYKIESGYQNPSYEFLSKLKKKFPEINMDEMFFR
ncbi:MAG: helix-turn-helix domain-containing protein [Thomasclavelia sp.]